MKASEARLLSLMQQSPQFRIPIYQRTYSWKEPECRQLWADVLRAGSTEVTGHFVGSIVYVESGLSLATRHAPLLVIDGQQRLTTVTLLVAALADSLDPFPEDEQEPVDGFPHSSFGATTCRIHWNPGTGATNSSLPILTRPP